MNKCLLTTALAVLTGFGASVHAKTAGTSIGRHLAKTVCGACHQTEAGSALPSPNPKAPSFAEISRMPSMTDLAIKVFLRSPHPSTPNIILSPEEIDSVTAYIRSLSRKE